MTEVKVLWPCSQNYTNRALNYKQFKKNKVLTIIAALYSTVLNHNILLKEISWPDKMLLLLPEPYFGHPCSSRTQLR